MLAECLRAWWPPPEENTDAKAASLVVAEVLLAIRSALKPKKR